MIRKIYIQISNLDRPDLKKDLLIVMNSLQGVIRVEHRYADHRLWLVIDTDQITEQELLQKIKELGGYVVRLHRLPMMNSYYGLMQMLRIFYLLGVVFTIFLGFVLPISPAYQSLSMGGMIIVLALLHGLMSRFTHNLMPQLYHNRDLIGLFTYLKMTFSGTLVLAFMLVHSFVISSQQYMGFGYGWLFILILYSAYFLSIGVLIAYLKSHDSFHDYLEKKYKKIVSSPVELNGRVIIASAILENDTLKLTKGATLPVDGQLLSESADLIINHTKKRYHYGDRLLAGWQVHSDVVYLKATSRVDNSLFAQQVLEGGEELSLDAHYSRSKKSQSPLSLSVVSLFIVAFMMLTHDFLLPWHWSKALWALTIIWIVSLRIVIYYVHSLVLFIKAWNLRWLTRRLEYAGVLKINFDAIAPLSRINRAVIHQNLLPLTLDYESAEIFSQQESSLLSDIWSKYCVGGQANILLSGRVELDASFYDVVLEQDVSMYGHASWQEQAKNILNNVDRDRYQAYFVCKEEYLGHILVPYKLTDESTLFVHSLSKLGLRPIIFSTLPQGIINDLSREIGLLEAYGTCSAQKSMTILESFMKKGDRVLYMAQREWDLHFFQKQEHFLIADVDSTRVLRQESDLTFIQFNTKDVLMTLIATHLFNDVNRQREIRALFFLHTLPFLLMISFYSIFSGMYIEIKYAFIGTIFGICSIFLSILAINNLKIMVKYRRWVKMLSNTRKSMHNVRVI